MGEKLVNLPYVVRTTPKGERAFDIFSMLLDERILFVTGIITDDEASSIIAQMLLLESENPNKDISMYISCLAGYPESTLAVYDTMQYIKCDITTICMGEASPMGTFLLSGGTRGKRRILPNANVVIEQFESGYSGSITDMKIRLERLESIKRTMNAILAENSGHTIEEIERLTERRTELSPQEAIDLGFADSIIAPNKPEIRP